MRRRATYQRASVRGFFGHPSVVAGSVFVIVACGIAGGLIVTRFIGGN